MALAIWSTRYATGIPEIDEQHQQLFSHINELHEAMRLGKGHAIIGRTLQGLQAYVDTHFRQEEEAMRAAGYPDLASHQVVHRYLTGQVRELVVKHRAGKLGTAVETSRFLAGWLQKHILDTDMKYIPWVKGERKAA
jgi:hemerythrin-like metal-binding protein